MYFAPCLPTLPFKDKQKRIKRISARWREDQLIAHALSRFVIFHPQCALDLTLKK